jgi:hypothetical protein
LDAAMLLSLLCGQHSMGGLGDQFAFPSLWVGAGVESRLLFVCCGLGSRPGCSGLSALPSQVEEASAVLGM